MNPAQRKALAEVCAAKKRKHIPRLPDGSRYDVVYHAATETWSGTLLIPGLPVIMQRCRGVFGLLSKLDECYRRRLQCDAKSK